MYTRSYSGNDSDRLGHFAELGYEGGESSGGVHVACGVVEGGVPDICIEYFNVWVSLFSSWITNLARSESFCTHHAIFSAPLSLYWNAVKLSASRAFPAMRIGKRPFVYSPY